MIKDTELVTTSRVVITSRIGYRSSRVMLHLWPLEAAPRKALSFFEWSSTAAVLQESELDTKAKSRVRHEVAKWGCRHGVSKYHTFESGPTPIKARLLLILLHSPRKIPPISFSASQYLLVIASAHLSAFLTNGKRRRLQNSPKSPSLPCVAEQCLPKG